MKSIILFFLFVFISLNIYSQPCPVPVGDANQTFCSQTAWSLISENSDTLADLKVCGDNLTWYLDAAGLNVIPETTILISNTTYYVSQTINGCESPLLAITVTETNYGCIKNPGFQTNQGTSNLNGYIFLQQSLGTIQGAPWSCNVNTNGGAGLSAATPYTLGPDNSMGHDAVIVTPGFDPTLLVHGVSLPRTSPYASCSSQAIRLNRNGVAPAKITSMRKEFIAGEVLSFDYAMVVQAPNHGPSELPFIQIKIYNENNVLIHSQCIRPNEDDCTLISVSTGFNTSTYSNWSCFQINTSNICGQAATVEFTVSDCSLSGHYGYAYFDNIYVGEIVSSACSNPDYGYVAITSVNSPNSVGYGPCSILSDPLSCGISSIPLNSQFPIDICGVYNPPQYSSVLQSMNIDLYQQGNLVGNVSQMTTTGTNNFCFTINASDITVPLYGEFSFDSSFVFEVNCGTPYNVTLHTANQNFKVCPTASCPAPLVICSTTQNGYGVFDLSQSITEIIGAMDPNEVEVFFYGTISDAETQSNPLASITNYNNSSPYNETVYARLDFDWAALGITPVADCFDIIELELIVEDIPIVTDSSNLNPLTVPDPNNTGNGVFDLTVQIPNIIGALTNVNVTFYENQADATNEQNSIVDPVNYTGIDGQIIYVHVKDINTNCSDTTSFELLLDTTMSVEDPKEINLKLYPNPAEDILYLQTNQFGSDVVIQVLGMQGNLLFSKARLTSEQIEKINVSQWASGVYFVKVISENTITLRKFVKK